MDSRDRLARNLAQLVEVFRGGKAASDFQWWNSHSARSIFYPLYGYQDGKPLFEEVVQGVLGINPNMLSQYEAERRIMYDFLGNQTVSWTQPNHLRNQSLVDEAKNFLNKLIEFEAWQDVDIPIANLWLEGEPVTLGRVIFMASTAQDLERWKADLLWPIVVARVRAPGDQQKALAYARTQVDLSLDVLRAFCFPFGRGSWRIGVVGDIISSASTPMRINNKFVTQLDSGITQIELRKHILSKLEPSQWELVKRLIPKACHDRMENKLLTSIHWLAESTKPDTSNSKLAKISVALEALLGGEPKEEELKVRGITAMLAERAAFIAGKDLDDRLAIDKDIRKYYGMRSKVLHGDERDSSLDDIDGFGQLVRRLALALLEKTDELGDKLGDLNKLEGWVKEQRYTLPASSSKEDSL